MGSFLGHAVPGTFFFTFATWWLYNVLYRYLYCRKFKPTGYRNTSSFPCPCNKAVPIESLFKIFAAIFGILGNAQHITMFTFFGFNGVVEFLMHKRWAFPPKSDYLFAALAFAVEGFLFYHHLHGRSHMDIQVHMFLFYLTVSCAVSVVAEMFQPTNVIPALCRVFFTLLQGSWFYQIGFILHSPFGVKWDEEDHSQMMIVTMMFTWHMAVTVIFMLGMGVLVSFRVNNSSGSLCMYQMVETTEPSSKESYGGNGGEPQHNYINGYVPFNKSDSSINRMLDSGSEEA